MATRIHDAVYLADLQWVAKKLQKRTLTTAEYDAHGRYSSSTIVKRFGSWPKALRKAGLEVGREYNVSDADFIADLQWVARKLQKRTLTTAEYDAHGRYNHTTIAKRFSSWPKALRKAGLEVGRERDVSGTKLLADMRSVAQKLRRKTLTRDEYDAHGRYSSSTIVKRFGSWPKALRKAGLNIGRMRNISNAHLLADLRRVTRVLRVATVAWEEYDEHGRYCSATIAGRFGSWPKALRKAGLAIRKEHRIPDAVLLTDMRSVAQKLRRKTLARDEYDAHGRYHSSTIVKRFGSWPKALRKAGLEVVARGAEISDTKLIADLRRVARKFGKWTLRVREYDSHGRYHSSTIVKRFGSWPKALRKAGLEVGMVLNIPDSDLLADMRRAARRLGRKTLTKDEYDAHGRYSSSTVVERFGSWPAALLAAKLRSSYYQITHNRSGAARMLRSLVSLRGLTNEERVEVAKELDPLKGIEEDVLLRYFIRMNAGPMELPTGTPSDGVALWEQCIQKLAKVQPDPEKFAKTKAFRRLSHQLHRAVAIELLGHEPLSPTEERRVMAELRRRRKARGRT